MQTNRKHSDLKPQGKTIIVFDGDMDKVLAAFVIANGALAMGRPVTMFFTFWGLTALRRTEKQKLPKSFVEKMFGAMLPRGAKKLKLSKRKKEPQDWLNVSHLKPVKSLKMKPRIQKQQMKLRKKLQPKLKPQKEPKPLTA